MDISEKNPLKKASFGKYYSVDNCFEDPVKKAKDPPQE